MSEQAVHYSLVFELDFDDRTAFETEARGYWAHSKVALSDGSVHPVVFYDPVRLAQDLEEEVRYGRPFIIEKGLVIVPAVTLENMKRAIDAAFSEGFFTAGD